jgi:hypothetical protein
MKLNPEELNVISFDTTAAPESDTDTSRQAEIEPIIISPNDPTAATWCYICPQETYRCW